MSTLNNDAYSVATNGAGTPVNTASSITVDAAHGLRANDVGSGAVSATGVMTGIVSSVVINADGSFTAQTTATGTGTFQYTDGSGATATVSLYANGVGFSDLVVTVPANVAFAAGTPIASAGSVTDSASTPNVEGLTVQITGGFTSGDTLTATLAGTLIQSSYNAGTGTLTLLGSDTIADYQQVLRSIVLSPGTGSASTRVVTFLGVTDGALSATNRQETITGIPVAAPTPTPPSAPVTPSSSAGLATAFSNLTRSDPNSAADVTPGTSLYTQAQAEQAIQAQYNAGKIFIQDAQLMQSHLVDGTTSLAEISYAFFTGATPTSAGLNYLVNSSGNPNDLNDPYYQSLSTDNRYINVAVGLGTGAGAGAASFNAAYGSLSLTDAATKAYTAIFGTAPVAGKITAILNELVPNGSGGVETRAQYLSDVSGGTSIAQKAALVGFFLSDSLKEGGTYATADQHFLADLAHGTAAYNVDLLVAYGPPLTTIGTPTPDPTVGH